MSANHVVYEIQYAKTPRQTNNAVFTPNKVLNCLKTPIEHIDQMKMLNSSLYQTVVFKKRYHPILVVSNTLRPARDQGPFFVQWKKIKLVLRPVKSFGCQDEKNVVFGKDQSGKMGAKRLI